MRRGLELRSPVGEVVGFAEKVRHREADVECRIADVGDPVVEQDEPAVETAELDFEAFLRQPGESRGEDRDRHGEHHHREWHEHVAQAGSGGGQRLGVSRSAVFR